MNRPFGWASNEVAQPVRNAQAAQCLDGTLQIAIADSRIGPGGMNKLANDMGQPVGAIFFGSSSVGEYSYEDSKLKAGVFTAALIEGLSGKADNQRPGETFPMNPHRSGPILRRVPEHIYGTILAAVVAGIGLCCNSYLVALTKPNFAYASCPVCERRNARKVSAATP
jgi:hypothetical protein